MSTKKENIAILGVGAAACAACCIGPIVGFLAAIGLGTAVGVALFGTVVLAIGALAAFILVRRHRRQATLCETTAATSVAVEPPNIRIPS